jgi:signal transduction histidine kinase
MLASLDARHAIRPNFLVFTDFDRERRRIEGELHDGVQQDLAAISGTLQQLAVQLLDQDPAAARALLEGLEAETRSALERVRVLAGEIYSSILVARGIAGALAGRAEVRAQERYGLELEEAVYFSCVALLDDSTTARIWTDDGVLRLEVDGPFRDDAVAHVRDRMTSVGGQVTVSGERLSASVPISGSAR